MLSLIRFREWLFRHILFKLDLIETIVDFANDHLCDVLYREYLMSQAQDNLTAAATRLEASIGTALTLLDTLKAAGNADPFVQSIADKLNTAADGVDAKVAADTPVA